MSKLNEVLERVVGEARCEYTHDILISPADRDALVKAVKVGRELAKAVYHVDDHLLIEEEWGNKLLASARKAGLLDVHQEEVFTKSEREEE